MKTRYMLALAALSLIGSSLHAQVPVLTSSFDNGAQQAGWQQYRNGDASFYEWYYSISSTYSGPACLAHGYPVGGSQPTDDWFVSPAFSIPQGGSLDSLRYAFSGFGVPAAGDTVFIYLLNGSQDPDLATKQIVHEFSGANYQNDNTWRLLAPITLPAQSGSSYLAFRYRTVNNWLDVRFDNVAVSKISGAGLGEQQQEAVRLFPNPATDAVQLQISSGWNNSGTTVLEICDAMGKQVLQQEVTSQQAVPLALAAGCYTYRVSAPGNDPVSGKLVIR